MYEFFNFFLPRRALSRRDRGCRPDVPAGTFVLTVQAHDHHFDHVREPIPPLSPFNKLKFYTAPHRRRRLIRERRLGTSLHPRHATKSTVYGFPALPTHAHSAHQIRLLRSAPVVQRGCDVSEPDDDSHGIHRGDDDTHAVSLGAPANGYSMDGVF